jgi:hypothetical protein
MTNTETYIEQHNKAIEEQRLAEQERKMCIQDLMLRIKDDLTASCSIPIQLPDNSLLSIINKTKKYFFDHYEYSVEEAYIYVHNSMYSQPEYLKSRSILLPDEVYSVFDVHKTGDSGQNIYNYITKKSFNYIYYGNTKTNEDLISYVIENSYASLRRYLIGNEGLKYNYNYLTHKLTILGETPRSNLVLDVYKTIPDCKLFNDDLFYRYVLAQARKNIAFILGTFNYNLPGGIQINFDLIQTMGQEEIDKIEEEIKGMQGADYFFVTY